MLYLLAFMNLWSWPGSICFGLCLEIRLCRCQADCCYSYRRFLSFLLFVFWTSIDKLLQPEMLASSLSIMNSLVIWNLERWFTWMQKVEIILWKQVCLSIVKVALDKNCFQIHSQMVSFHFCSKGKTVWACCQFKKSKPRSTKTSASAVSGFKLVLYILYLLS